MIGTFSSSFGSHVLVCSVLVTSISKLNSFTYFSGALQLNDGCVTICQCTSPVLAALPLDAGPVSASLSAITANVTAWIATCKISVWIASDSAISASFCKTVCLFSGLPTSA